MKNLLYAAMVILFVIGCSTTKSNFETAGKTSVAKKTPTKNDTIRIANDSLEYEVIIIDPGFNTWLNSVARPRGFYSQSVLENRNIFFVSEYNQRVLQPFRYNPNLYEMRIDYQSNINYGYEVNYLLYNYFMYFQREYRQKL